MGAFQKLSEIFAKQTAVYWASPTPDGYGGNTWDDPVEISVRWDDISEEIKDSKGIETVSRAKIIVTQDVDLGGMLYLGTLDDLDSEQEGDPMTVDGAYPIIKFSKIPAPLKTDDFFRMAYV